jgi:tetratricopeptide (TPR) repeat protein
LSLFQSPKDSSYKADLLELIGKSNWHLALSANANTDAAQVDKWYRDCASNIKGSGEVRPGLNPDSRRVLASCYERIAERLIPTDLNAAMQMAGNALQIDSTDPQAHGTKGLVLWNKGDAEGAIAALDQAARLDPRYAWAYGFQAWIRLKQDNYADARKYAHKAIDADSTDPWGYQILGDAFHKDGKDSDAIKELDLLRQRFPGNPWPIQTEMFVYHEDLTATDPLAFQKTYALYLELQKPQYLPQITNADDVEAGFIEANLTTGRLAEAADRGAKFLERTKAHPDLQETIPVGVIVYAALVLKGDTAKAAMTLGALEAALKKLPKDFKADWSYQGTLRYIRASKAPEPLKSSVAELVQAIDKDPLQVPPAVLQTSREAIRRKWFF